MIPVAVPIVGGVVLAGLGIMRFLKVRKSKATAAVITTVRPTVITVTPAAKAASTAQVANVPAPAVIEFPPGPESAVGQQAIVTTHDAPPAGDLIIRDAPNGTKIGMAEKDGTVIVLRDADSVFAEVIWGGGTRYPAAQGFAKKQFLKLLPAGTTIQERADIALDVARARAQVNPTDENIAAAQTAALEAEPQSLVIEERA